LLKIHWPRKRWWLKCLNLVLEGYRLGKQAWNPDHWITQAEQQLVGKSGFRNSKNWRQ
jgi:hypothetical protein